MYSSSSIRKAILLTRYVNLLKESNKPKSTSEEKSISSNTLSFEDDKKHKLTVFKEHMTNEIEFIKDNSLAKEVKNLEKLIKLWIFDNIHTNVSSDTITKNILYFHLPDILLF